MTSNNSVNHSTQPQLQVVWVGGALDKYTQLLRQFVGPNQHYFQWFEYAALARWLRQHQHQQEPVLLIGHSYGASTAAAVVAAGHPVQQLITIDPVSWRKPDGWAVRQYAGLWQNYLAADARLNFANLVARCGGQWQQWPASFAHQHKLLQADHATVVARALLDWRAEQQTQAASAPKPSLLQG
ncbi:alpha/beta fold hydrolase [Rheinheimera sp.]|uniref:alpha/beta fold hydrolase n=1 Tax=Rheinheimera sp. TaxID=1869214 RepID=UPI002FDCC987